MDGKRSIGRFELLDFLGRGGSGDVHLARDPQRGTIALKLIRIGVDAEMLEAERRGVELQKHLQPKVPQIAAIYDSGELGGFFYVAMEYVQGRDLDKILLEGVLPPAQAVEIAIQLCRILEAIEEASRSLGEGRSRVVHSDIKPSNIRLQEGGQVRLLDFGVAKNLRLSRNFTHNTFGSTPYLAPERIADAVVDAQTDLWAVSVVLFEMLAGSLPFPGGTTEALERRIRTNAPPEPLPPDCPPALRAILLKCLRLDPHDRFSDAQTLRRHLEAFQKGVPLPLSEPTRPQVSSGGGSVPPSRPPVTPGPAPVSPDRRPPSRAEKRQKRSGGLRKGVLFLVGLSLAILASVQWYGCYEARQIRDSVSQTGESELERLVERFEDAKPYDPLRICLRSTAAELRTALVAVADRTLRKFRVEPSTPREDWDGALKFLRLADRVGQEEAVQAKISLFLGQIARLDAEELVNSEAEAARQKWQEAIEYLEIARKTAPEVVDTYLALALIYGEPRSGHVSREKLQGVLAEAERRGLSRPAWGDQSLVKAWLREGRERRGQAELAAGRERDDTLHQALDCYEEAVKLCEEKTGDQPWGTCQRAREEMREINGQPAHSSV